MLWICYSGDCCGYVTVDCCGYVTVETMLWICYSGEYVVDMLVETVVDMLQ
jgi:hypothetical protein